MMKEIFRKRKEILTLRRHAPSIMNSPFQLTTFSSLHNLRYISENHYKSLTIF